MAIKIRKVPIDRTHFIGISRVQYKGKDFIRLQLRYCYDKENPYVTCALKEKDLYLPVVWGTAMRQNIDDTIFGEYSELTPRDFRNLDEFELEYDELEMEKYRTMDIGEREE